MSEIAKRIEKAFEEGKTLVFPSENSARSYLESYVKNSKGRAIFNDRAVSWDTFRLSCCDKSVIAGKTCADYSDRALFTSRYFSSPEQLEQLRHFSNPDFKESAGLFAKEIASNLPYMGKVLSLDLQRLDANLVHDVKLFFDLYSKYLDENNLYESSWLEPDFRDRKNHVLVFPSSVRDPEVVKAIEAFPEENIIDCRPEDSVPYLTFYDNSAAEIKACIVKIRELLESGVPARDIAITLADYDASSPFLLQEAYIRNIRLFAVKGRKLTDFPSGRFFSRISDIEAREFEHSVVKDFLLDPSYPFSCRTVIDETVRLGTELKVETGGHGASLWLSKLAGASESRNREWEKAGECLLFMTRFRDYIAGINGARDANALRKAVKGFQDDFFMDASWRSTERDIDINVFQRCMDILDKLEQKVQRAGFGSFDGFYQLFLDVLDNTIYTSNTAVDGVRLFSYPSSCAVDARYHFVLGLTDEVTTMTRDAFPFIAKGDDEFEAGLGRVRIGDDILRAYGDCIMSGAEQSYSSVGMAPALFVEKNRVRNADKGVITDSFSNEELLWREKDAPRSCTEKQRKWFENSLSTTLRIDCKDDFLSCEDKVRLSATSLETYKDCPFKWYVTQRLGVKDKRFSPDMVDNMNIGNILHQTYEDYFEKYLDWQAMKTQTSREDLHRIFLAKLRRYSRQPDSTSAFHIKKMETQYEPLLDSLFDKVPKELPKLENSSLHGLELCLSEDFGSFYVKNGRIDCLMKTEDGDYIILDFKKKSVAKDSLQVVLYARMLGDGPDIAKLPVYGAYYKIEGESFLVRFNDSEVLQDAMEELDSLTDSIVQSVRNGFFDYSDSEKNCEACAFRRACRKRYVIK